jgi:DNA polymerase-3 subunit gamma/tau
MHPALKAGGLESAPYTADQREAMDKINETIKLNALSRIWQVMVASVSEIQAAGNQKQAFDMLVIRLMHIADMPSIPELMKQQSADVRPCPATGAGVSSEAGSGAAASNKNLSSPPSAASQPLTIASAGDLSVAFSNAKELLLKSYWDANCEVSEFSDGRIVYFDRKGDRDFAQKLSVFLQSATGKSWVLEKLEVSAAAPTATERQKAELESDPMVADALSLFAGAELVAVK